MTPYRTPAITLPFPGFYGFVWAAVFYFLGYLVLVANPPLGSRCDCAVIGRGSPSPLRGNRAAMFSSFKERQHALKLGYNIG